MWGEGEVANCRLSVMKDCTCNLYITAVKSVLLSVQVVGSMEVSFISVLCENGSEC